MTYMAERPFKLNATAIKTFIFVILTALVYALPAGNVFAQTISTPQDCSANSVIYCGVTSVNEVQKKYRNNDSVKAIFNGMGIYNKQIASMDNNTVNGMVTRDNQVMVNGNVVANDALTVGRQDISNGNGRSSPRTNNGTTFYVRHPNVSFAQDSLPAFVVMKNGQFDFAVIAACGNPVIANSTSKTTAQQATNNKTTAVAATTKAQPTQVIVTSPPPAPVVVNTPAPQPTVARVIPNTGGPSDVMGMGAFVSLLGGFGHLLYKRSKFST
jgi:hypothetical protein